MALSELDLTDRANWTCENVPHIAQLLGFECTPQFTQVFHEFLEEFIQGATVMAFIQIVATRHFSERGCKRQKNITLA